MCVVAHRIKVLIECYQNFWIHRAFGIMHFFFPANYGPFLGNNWAKNTRAKLCDFASAHNSRSPGLRPKWPWVCQGVTHSKGNSLFLLILKVKDFWAPWQYVFREVWQMWNRIHKAKCSWDSWSETNWEGLWEKAYKRALPVRTDKQGNYSSLLHSYTALIPLFLHHIFYCSLLNRDSLS